MPNNPTRKQQVLKLQPVTPEELAAARSYLAKHAPDLMQAITGEEAPRG